jgi:hypothetical protein
MKSFILFISFFAILVCATAPVISAVTLPQPPVGLRGSLSSGKTKFTLNWNPVTKNTDNTDISDLAGYIIYRGYSPTIMSSCAFVTSGSLSWTDQDTAGGSVYYRVSALNNSGHEGRAQDQQIINSLGSGKLIMISDDQSLAIEIPATVAAALQDIDLRFEENTGSENGNILLSYTLGLYSRNGEAIKTIQFDEPLSIKFFFGSGTPVSQRAALRSVSNSDLTGLTVFWNNGLECLKVGGTANRQDQFVLFKASRPGEYQLRAISKAPVFGLATTNPKKVFTPGVAPYEKMEFYVDNPEADKVEGQIFDLRGAFVANLILRGEATAANVILEWDGARDNGDAAKKGVYIYQIKGSGRTINGTIILAK